MAAIMQSSGVNFAGGLMRRRPFRGIGKSA